MNQNALQAAQGGTPITSRKPPVPVAPPIGMKPPTPAPNAFPLGMLQSFMPQQPQATSAPIPQPKPAVTPDLSGGNAGLPTGIPNKISSQAPPSPDLPYTKPAQKASARSIANNTLNTSGMAQQKASMPDFNAPEYNTYRARGRDDTLTNPWDTFLNNQGVGGSEDISGMPGSGGGGMFNDYNFDGLNNLIFGLGQQRPPTTTTPIPQTAALAPAIPQQQPNYLADIPQVNTTANNATMPQMDLSSLFLGSPVNGAVGPTPPMIAPIQNATQFANIPTFDFINFNGGL